MIKLLLTIILLSGSLYAKLSNNFLMERVERMQSLETAMHTIQKGFLYNSDMLVQAGINKLRYNLSKMDTFGMQNDDAVDFNAKKYTIAEIKSLNKLSSKLQNDFTNKKKQETLSTYQNILNRCLTCHKITRKW